MSQPASLTLTDPERTLEYEFVRATENAAVNALQWLDVAKRTFDAAERSAHVQFR